MKKNKQPYSLKSISIVVYPESCPEFEQLIETLPIKRYAYILHSRDKEENGEIKKSHYHFIAQFTKYVNTKALLKKLGLSPDFPTQPLGDWVSMIRYFQHLDNPEKEPYSYKEIISNIELSSSIGDYCDKEEKASYELKEILKIIDRLCFKYNGSLPIDIFTTELINKKLIIAYKNYYYICRDYIRSFEEGNRLLDMPNKSKSYYIQ